MGEVALAGNSTRAQEDITGGVNPWFIAAAVTIAAFMELLDTSIANVSLPYIGGGLGRSYDEVTWILTTYLVANAVVLPMSAWLSRMIGRKNYYLACVVLFTVSSLMCGLAPSLGFMLFWRVIQGIGGGGLAPVAQSVLVDTFPPAKRAAAFAIYTIVIVTAPAVGPVLGGWITDNYNWRWIFLINVPFGFLSFFLCSRLIHDPEAFTQERLAAKLAGKLKIDGIGIVLITLASGALEISLDRGQIDDWFGSSFITTMIFLAVTGWIATVWWELRVPEPVVDFRLLGNRNFAVAAILLFTWGIGLFGTTTLLPQLLQSMYGYRAIDAGLVMGLGALAITVLAPVTAQLIQRKLMSPKIMVLVSLTITALAMFIFSDMNLATDAAHYRWIRVLQGIGYGFFMVPVNMIAYSNLRPDQNNRASSFTNFMRNWGGSFGIAFLSFETERRGNLHQSNLVSNLFGSSQPLHDQSSGLMGYLMLHGFTGADAQSASFGVVYQQLLHQSSFLAFMDCFRCFAWLTVACISLVFLVKKSTGKGTAPVGGH